LRKLWAIVCVLVCLAPGAALGEAGADGDRAGQAKQHFLKGSQHYVQHRYKEALGEFQAALKLERRASTLLNIAQCYRQLDRPKQAVAYYRAYLSAWKKSNPGKPPGQAPFYIEVNQHITTLSRKTRSGDEAGAGQAPAAAVTRPGSSKSATPATAQTTTPLYKKWWFWTIVGAVVVGAAAAGTAAALQPEPADPVMGTFPPGQVKLPLTR